MEHGSSACHVSGLAVELIIMRIASRMNWIATGFVGVKMRC